MHKLLLVSTVALGTMVATPTTGFAQSADDDSGAAATPAPGTITVRLNGRFRTFGGLVADGDANRAVFYNPTTGAAATAIPSGSGLGFRSTASNAIIRPTGAVVAGTGVPASLVGATLQYNKQGNYTIEEYTRLYPGFDGVAANGLKYGAQLEIRQDNYSGAGGGVYGSISQQSRQRGELYLRREWGYVGTDQLGTVRFGATDGPLSLFQTGTFANFNDGGWTGDVKFFPAQNTAPIWPFASDPNLYTTTKILYLSPQYYGVDFGLGYEPSTASVGLGSSNGCNGSDAINSFIVAGPGIAGAGCDRLASTSTGDYLRRRNTIDVAVRYRGKFGPLGIAAMVDYVGGGTVEDSSVPALTGNRNQFDGLSVGTGGLVVSYAGIAVGGTVQGGRFNGQWSPAPNGSSDALAYVFGTSYTYGPMVVGTQIFEYDSPGVSGPLGSGFGLPRAANVGFSPLVGQRRERGVAAGGTYALAPGLALMLSYLWGDRKENGFDLLTGQVSTPASPNLGANHNYVHVQVLTLGVSMTW